MVFAVIALFLLACLLAGLGAVYLHDKRQTEHTILRNFPLIGHIRYFAETWGEYMRQYQYLPDWAERPFKPAGAQLGLPVVERGLQPAQLRQRKCAGLRLPQRRLRGAGRGDAGVSPAS